MEVGSTKERVQMVWTLDSCSDIMGAQVFSFEDEKDLLMSSCSLS